MRDRHKVLDPQQWYMRMKDIPCFILGNGPSIKDIDLSILNTQFTVGINRIFFKYDPTILIWQDLALWQQEEKRVMGTKSIKYCRRGSFSRHEGEFYNFVLEGKEATITHDLKKLYGRGSSGSIVYQFVWGMGCNPIILVGMDCKNGKNGDTDFYGKNPMHKRHTLPYCVKGLNFIKDSANRTGRTILNCSNNDVFTEKLTLEEAIHKAGDKRYTREDLIKILVDI